MNQKLKATIREYGESFLIAFVIALVIRTFLIQAYKIPTGSMNPTLMEGDRIMVNKFSYNFRPPLVGEIIVFKFPENPKLAFIKRLIAKGQEKVEIKDGHIFINNQELSNPRIINRFYYNRGPYGEKEIPVLVPENNFYVLGDNSANSRDSRYWGFVPKKNLIGRAMFIYWPLYRIRLIE